jgi:hypothetical protein
VDRGLWLVVFCSIEMAGRETLDAVDIRLLHELEELARIGREALDVAALALGVDGVEGQARLAGAGQPGQHHELAARQVEVEPP